MELFPKIVKDKTFFTVFAKNSILDVTLGSKYVSGKVLGKEDSRGKKIKRFRKNFLQMFGATSWNKLSLLT